MSRIVAAIAFALAVGAESGLAGQDPPALPSTEWGEPSVEGTWLTANADGRPFARPDEDSDASLLAQLIESGAIERVSRLDPAVATQREQEALAAWRAARKSPRPLVIEPADGRVPALTPAARERAARQWRTTVTSMGPWAGPDDMGPVERCISRGPLGSMLPSVDYSAIQIVQGPGVVTIRSEAIHEARVIPIGGNSHVAPSVRTYMGDARGYWDGDTLVVETTNFNGRTGAQSGGNEVPTSDALHIVERFSRTGVTSIDYQMQVSDPGTWTASWTVAYPLAAAPDYAWSEYACHEGNYAMRNLLSISRAAERSVAPPSAAPAPPRPRPRAPLPQRPQRPAPRR
jgi:hypothetical protein